MYLFPGLIFVSLAFFTFVDSMGVKNTLTPGIQVNRIASNCLLAMTIALASLSWAPRWINDFIHH
ncbi:hypothetical protein ICE89_06345 [Polynucleobacter sp. AP-Kaivos-20-H2]|nr:hypothetical protein [Polynucleobacter sp. AP-Kaivos-20-H2]